MQTPRPRVMVVDDEPDIVRGLAMRLKLAGYDVVTASDGVKATQTAIAEQPDVIVLDIGLPAGDGHAVANRIRQHVKTMNIPIIYLTARTARTDVRQAQDVEAVGYLVKPYDPEELLFLVQEALTGRRGRGVAQERGASPERPAVSRNRTRAGG